MVIEFSKAKTARQKVKDAETDYLKEQQLGKINKIINTLDNAYTALIVNSQASKMRKPIVRTYDKDGSVCPYCNTVNTGWISEDYYPEGVDDFIIEQLPYMTQYRNRPYRLKYPEHEVMECLVCGKILKLKGRMLERALKNVGDESK